MKFMKLTAVIRDEMLEKVKASMQGMGVRGITVDRVKGYGEYVDSYSRDWMVDHIRIEIITHEDRVDPIASAIMEQASSSLSGDGIIAVTPIDKLYRIRTKAEITD